MLRLSILIGGTLGAGLCLAFLMFGGAETGLRPLSAAEAEQVIAGQSSSSSCQSSYLTGKDGCNKNTTCEPLENAGFKGTGTRSPRITNCLNKAGQKCGALTLSKKCT
jgi:hypothetical protein